MNNDNHQTTRQKRNISWQIQPNPEECEHQYEVFAQEEGGFITRCTKCGSLEAQ